MARDRVSVVVTGLGATTPAFAAGELPDKAGQAAGIVQVTLGVTVLAPSNVLYAGVTPSNAGLYQVNIRIPDTAADGDQPIVVSINGNASPAGAYVSVKR